QADAGRTAAAGAGLADLRVVLQAEQRGTGHAVACTATAFTGFAGDVLILYGDVPRIRAATLRALLDAHRAEDADLTLATICFAVPTGYGRIVRGADGGVTRIVEERDATPAERTITEVNPGLYCVRSAILFPLLAELRPATVIGPNVVLRGRTRLGAGCRLDGTAYLVDATVGDRVHVRFGTVMEGAEVGADAVIGPFARLRPGTRLAERVHLGNFVETKQAILGAGTKANHLTYLGDCEVGPDTNVGAGTITCNYDGFAKHRTRIGARVQIGSDTQLVAPVSVGDDAYVGAGTTVTRDVPPGALV